MSEQHPSAVVTSRLDRHRRISWIWAIPVVTAIIGTWLAWTTLSQRGPLITISFETAEGLQADQSHVRHKDVDMGVVTKVALSTDMKRVTLTVRMNREAEPLLTDGAQFYVVRPRFFAGSLTGLQTLVSGSYIDLVPAQKSGPERRSFIGLETPPVLQSDVPGRTFLLQAGQIGSLNLGSPVMFRDLDVGEVLGWDIGEMARNITVHVFVRAPYDKYVHDDSRFWNASGVKASLGGSGLQLQVQSLRAVVLGGVAFDTPDDSMTVPESQPNHTFPLYADQDAAQSSSYTRTLPFVADFTGSVSGLAVGTNVTLHGLKIGEVTGVSLVYDRVADNVIVPVHFQVEPERIALLQLPETGEPLTARLQVLIKRGLRVSLESANVLTGQKQLAIDLYKDAPPAQLSRSGDAYVIPVLGGGSEDVATAASNLVNRLNGIPFEAIGQSLNTMLAGASTLVNDKHLSESVASLQQTLAGTQTLIANLDRGMTPLSRRMPAIAAQLEEAVKRLNTLSGSLNTGYGGDSRFNRDLSRMMNQLSDAARSMRVLADLLSRHPEALIRGRTDQGTE